MTAATYQSIQTTTATKGSATIPKSTKIPQSNTTNNTQKR